MGGTPHAVDLRSNLYRLGVPDMVIQRILRHANVSTTATYFIKTTGPTPRLRHRLHFERYPNLRSRNATAQIHEGHFFGVLDSSETVDYPHPQVGVLVEKRTGRTFAVSLVTAVILACIVPVPDQPETFFNEADTPVNQATVVSPVRIAFPSEMTTPLPALRAPGAQEMKRIFVEPKSVPMYSDSVPLRFLLCSFVI